MKNVAEEGKCCLKLKVFCWLGVGVGVGVLKNRVNTTTVSGSYYGSMILLYQDH